MNKNIVVSVIIPMYNSERTIERALNSVVNQTYQGNIEIIVINDGSQDNSLNLVKEYKKKLNKENIEIFIINKKNGGVSTARNEGLRKAKGKYIALLDSDDEWLKTKLETQIELLKNNSKIDFLGSQVNYRESKIMFKKISKLKKIELKHLLIKWLPPTPTVIFKKEILDTIGYYDEEFKYGEDGNFLLRACIYKNVYYLPETLVLIGNGKADYGDSGLSKNLYEMEKGELRNWKMLYKISKISLLTYFLVSFYSILKYFRRCIIVKFRRGNVS